MMLGDMLAAARKSAGRFQAWLEGSNPALAAQVVERAAIQGLSPAAYVRVAVADFASLASEADWATLISRVRDSGDPGQVRLLAMVHWRLSPPHCGCHAAEGVGLHDRTVRCGRTIAIKAEERHFGQEWVR